MNLLRRSKSSLPFFVSKITRFKDPLLPSRSSFAAASGRVVSAHPSPDGCGWRRSYYTARPDLQHFRHRQTPRWYHNPRAVIAVVLLGGGAAVTIYFGNLETVPYTKRSHFVLLSPSTERQLGEAQFNELKSALRGKILPPLHPDSIRVRLISKEIIEAVQRGLHHGDRRWTDVDYASPDFPSSSSPEKSRDTIQALVGGGADEGKGDVDARWSKEDEVLDDKWVHQSRKDGAARGAEPATRHLEGLNWEVLVVRDAMINAMCLPGGKIIVFTGLLDHFRTDAEIATVIGHEVGHAIARHSAEGITKNLWFAILQLVLLQFFGMPDLINTMSNLLLRLPFSRRMEMEADYIGLLLIASAGYDPRVAPGVYEKLGQVTGDSALRDYLSTHPSSKKRAQILSQGVSETFTIVKLAEAPTKDEPSMEVMPTAISPEFHFASGAASPYQSAPSSPRPFGDPLTYQYHYTSAPATPTRAAAIYSHLIAASASPTDTPRRSTDVSNFSFTPDRQQDRLPEIAAADKFYEKGRIRQLQPPSQPTYSSRSKRRESRSLSPPRDERFSTKNTCSSPANSTSNKGGASRRWPRLKDLFLFRSASEGRATGRGSKDPLRKYTLLPSVSISNNTKGGREDKKSGGVKTAGSDGLVRRGGGPAVSAHELLYTENRAAAEEQRKKTPLPYRRHGLLGFIQFNPAVRVMMISKGANSSSFSRGS